MFKSITTEQVNQINKYSSIYVVNGLLILLSLNLLGGKQTNKKIEKHSPKQLHPQHNLKMTKYPH